MKLWREGLLLVLVAVLLARAGVGLHATRRLSWADSTAAVSGGEPISSVRLHGKAVVGIDLRTGQRLSDDFSSDLSIAAEFSNRYIRIEDGPFAVIRTGFAGATPISARTFKAGASPTSASTQVRDGFVAEQRSLLNRLALGEFALSDRTLGLVIVPDGPSSFHVTGRDGFDCVVDVDSVGLPVKVRYQTIWQFFVPKDGAKPDVSRQKAEMVTEFSDRRPVGKARVAYRMVSVAHSLVGNLAAFDEDVVLDRVEINPRLSAADFR